ncbi:4-hydroxyphenylacetate 3-hydroxylase N-terminal domain-containing protein [Streptomyces sp. NPDC001034]|uniref:4-hydroxyphenylacetate 3-hydroxylase N-terminal domain-containing protein n=1 Tax=Streptomyces sp. NPDC001034 TaxID=3154375 RepID=UPI00331CFE7A
MATSTAPPNGSRTGKSYLVGLADGRRVYLAGRPVADLAHDPRTEGMAAFLADLLDEHRPDGELTGRDGHPLAYSLAHSAEEVRERGRAFARIARLSGGLMGRSPDFVATVLTAWAGAADHFGPYADNVRAYWRHARAANLLLTHAISDPPADRHLGPRPDGEVQALRAIRTTDEGVVVRGAKMLATLSPFADDLVIYPFRPLGESETDQALCFAVPVATPGLTLYSRPSYASAPAGDGPLAGRFDELDAICHFDDVLVPWDRVFIHGDVDRANNLRPGTGMTSYAWHQSAVRAWVKAETVYDLAARCARAAGRDRQPLVRQQLGELAGIVETLRGLVVSAETGTRPDEFGQYVCESVPLAASGMLNARLYPRAVELLQAIASSGLVMHPVTADEDPESAGHAFMQTYFAGDGVDGLAHGRLLRAAADLTMNRFGTRQVLYERLFLGPPEAFQAKFHDLFAAGRPVASPVLDGLDG